jgi:hypothetical protein
MTTKISEIRVANVVMDVEAAASLGILSRELLIMINPNLDKTAKNIAAMNRQSVIKRHAAEVLSKFPEISDRSPVSAIEKELVTQKIRIQKITAHIEFRI